MSWEIQLIMIKIYMGSNKEFYYEEESEFDILRVRAEYDEEYRQIALKWNEGLVDRMNRKQTLEDAFDIRHKLQYWFKKEVVTQKEWDALLNDNFKTIKELIEEPSIDLTHTLDRGDSYLHKAVRYHGKIPDMFEIIRLLIHNGADVNALNEMGDTPLFVAVDFCGSNDAQLVGYLIQNGASVHILNNKGENVLHKLGENITPNPKTLEILLDSGVDVNAQTTVEKKTPLMYFYRGKQYSSYTEKFDQLSLILIKAGCDLNLQDSRGKTILFTATSRYDGNSFLTTELIGAGIDTSIKDNIGFAFTHYLSDKKRLKLGL